MWCIVDKHTTLCVDMNGREGGKEKGVHWDEAILIDYARGDSTCSYLSYV